MPGVGVRGAVGVAFALGSVGLLAGGTAPGWVAGVALGPGWGGAGGAAGTGVAVNPGTSAGGTSATTVGDGVADPRNNSGRTLRSHASRNAASPILRTKIRLLISMIPPKKSSLNLMRF